MPGFFKPTLFKPTLAKAMFGAQVMLAIAGSPLALAQETRPATPAADVGDEAPFLKENEAAMTKMMNDMAAKPTGDTDRDFVAMMIPHHQGALDMAVIELRYGKNEQLRRIAQEIIVDQMQEIDAMKLAIGEPVTASAAAPTRPDATPPVVESHPMAMQNMAMPNTMKMSPDMKK
jgi:hypothetical protein